MGTSISTEEKVEKAKTEINSEDCKITLRFPGFQDNDVKFLKNQKILSQLFSNVPSIANELASLAGLPGGVGTLLSLLQSRVCKSTDHIVQALAELKVEKKIVQNAHSFVKAEMSSIERQLQLYSDPALSNKQKKTCLAIADNACYQLLEKFCDPDFYLRKYPLVYAPFLVNFVAVYVPIAQANLQLTNTTQRQEDARRNMIRLRNLIKYFRDESIKDRLKHITELRNIYNTGGIPIYTLFLSKINKYLTSNFIFLMDTYRNTDNKYEPVYGLSRRYREAFKIIYEWHRQQARELYESYFVQPLQSIEQFL